MKHVRMIAVASCALLSSVVGAAAGDSVYRSGNGDVYRTHCYRSSYGVTCYDTVSPGGFTGNSARVMSIPDDYRPAPDDWAKNCPRSCVTLRND